MNAYENHGFQLNQRACAGVTLVELMVALAIGSFLIIGAVQIATQSRHAFRVNESIARVQETAQFVMDTLESDLRMASNWGMLSQSDAIEGRSLPTVNADPLDLLPDSGSILECGDDWALDLMNPLEGSNNDGTFPCATAHGEQARSDTLTIRRASVNPVDPATLVDGQLYIQSTRTKGQIFDGADGVPAGFTSPTADTETHTLLVNTYYVAPDSALIPGAPTLRRKTLTEVGNVVVMQDQEVAPGVENLQVQFGVDVDQDGAVDRYVNPDNVTVLDDPANRVMTARIWLVVRSVDPEIGIVDDRTYTPADAALGDYDDQYRRLQVSKTILLRNARS